PFAYPTQTTQVMPYTFSLHNANPTSANQNVIIHDTTPPVTPTLANVTGQCSATATTPTTTDNCAGTVTGTTSDPLTYNTQGTHVIHWTTSHNNGNTTTSNHNVTIDDT